VAILEIVTYPDKFLRQPTQPVETIDDELQKIIDDMAETMYAAPGVGLAAIQVGIGKSLFIYDIAPREEGQEEKRDLQVLINPVIVSHEGEQLSEDEGCLSVPDLRADVKRYAQVQVKAFDRHGNPLDIEAEGMHAIVLQHEIDHLNGVLFIDHISALKREMYKRKVKKRMKLN
jgi:peptide deformylase